jgi:hypothetical protein
MAFFQARYSERVLGGVVGQADAAIVEEAREGGPFFEHIVECLCDRGLARERTAPVAQPCFQVGGERGSQTLANRQSLRSRLAGDRTLGVEDAVDPRYRFERDWR